jgi:hypothetical protein
MQHHRNPAADGAPGLSLVASPDVPRGREPISDRDVLADLADAIDDGIARLPVGSPWRAWLAKPSRVLRAAACLPPLRAVQGGDR